MTRAANVICNSDCVTEGLTSWVTQSELQITLAPEAASFSALQAVAPAGNGHLCVELQQQACTDGSGAGVHGSRCASKDSVEFAR